MEDFVIAVRTYKRQEIFKKNTYRILQENNLTERLYIFVADEEEKQAYAKSLEGLSYKEIVIGEKGAVQATRAIHRYFPIGQRIFFMDDDLKQFYTFSRSLKLTPRSLKLQKYLEDAFETLDKENYKIFAFSSSTNGLWVRNKCFKEFTVKHIYGGAFGARNCTELIPRPNCFDDVARTLRFFEYGGVLHYNTAGFTILKMGTLEGGMQDSGDRGAVEKRQEYQEQKMREIYEENKMAGLCIEKNEWDEEKQMYITKYKNKRVLKKIFEELKISVVWRKYDWPEWIT